MIHEQLKADTGSAAGRPEAQSLEPGAWTLPASFQKP